MRKTLAPIVSAALLMTTSVFAADVVAPLPAGKPAGVKRAQADDDTLLYILGGAAVIAVIAIAASSGGSSNNGGGSTTTTTS